MYEIETVEQQIARLTSYEPCIVMGCTCDRGHEGPHDIDADLLADMLALATT